MTRASVAETLDDLFAYLLGPTASALPGGTPAKAANSANREHPCGLEPDAGVCEGLRKAANSQPEPAEPSQDSQKFAALRRVANPAQSKQPCGFSQDSQDSQGYPAANASRTCRACTNRLPAGNCDKPTEAGLLPVGSTFAILWAPDGHAATCSAFTAKMTVKAPDRPYRLSRAEGDAAHAVAWNDAAIARFVARVALLMRRGFNATDADDLAERLHLRDVTGDDRAIFVECVHLAGRTGAWHCGNQIAADVGRDLPAALVTTMQRCAGFQAKG